MYIHGNLIDYIMCPNYNVISKLKRLFILIVIFREKMSCDEMLRDYEEETSVSVSSVVPIEERRDKLKFSSIHSSGFRDLLLKPELLQAIKDRGYEHPSQGKF